MKVGRVKGTRDLLPPETERWDHVEKTARRVFSSYGYGEIRTPILESTDLFVRSVGEATDIVHKEMYTFQDRGDRSITLRPENTAGVVRAVVENRLDQGPMPLRLFYIGPQFRYERPQKGRYREFRQIGAELFGASGPAADAEVLFMLFDFLGALGFRRLSVSLNAVPGREGRESYSAAIRAHAEKHASGLGDDDRRRLAENPLRLFDSKDPATAKILEDAPRAVDYLDPASRHHHDELKALLSAGGLAFAENPRLVRGLDYYTRTVFEVTSSDLGAQDAILGGGRYDGLVADLGGPDLPGVGFAIGEDRLVDLLPAGPPGEAEAVRVIPMSEGEAGYALDVAARLRRTRPRVELDLSGRGLKKGLAVASERDFAEAAIVGPDEARERRVTMKNLRTREQRTVPISEVV
ncbi:MAG: histidine--tRNA ligase [Thermoanaerobaculia bacterium]